MFRANLGGAATVVFGLACSVWGFVIGQTILSAALIAPRPPILGVCCFPETLAAGLLSPKLRRWSSHQTLRARYSPKVGGMGGAFLLSVQGRKHVSQSHAQHEHKREDQKKDHPPVAALASSFASHQCYSLGGNQHKCARPSL